GCRISVTGSPECTPMPVNVAWSRSVVCLPLFILPSHLSFAVCPRRHTPNQSYGPDGPPRWSRLGMKVFAVSMSPRFLSPDKTPLSEHTLTADRHNANSRFFTDCYLDAAALMPPGRRKSAPAQ